MCGKTVFDCLIYAILLHLMEINIVLSEPDLCENPKIDSIAYIDDQRQYFFTSGGYYWLIKDSEFPPPKEKAKPLPNGFKRGDAAVYKNTLKACADPKTAGPRPQEQEIYLIEKTDSGNKMMAFDLRDFSWKPPYDYNKDRSIGQAQIDWTKAIDAMFVYKLTQIYVIQSDRYAAIDYKNLCDKPDGFAKPFQNNPRSDFQTVDDIDAMTMIDSNHLLMFQNGQVFRVKINSARDGKVVTQKDSGQSVTKDFLKLGQGCAAPPVSPTDQITSPSAGSDSEPPKPPSNVTPGQEETHAEEQPTQPPEGGQSPTTKEKSEEKGGGLWIIIIIVVVIIVIIVIALIAVMAMRKKKSDPEAGKEGVAAEGADASAGSKVSSSKIGSEVTPGSKVSPNKIGSKVNPSSTASKMTASSSLGGTSPSKMSVRSKMSAIPSGVTSKSKSNAGK